MQSTWEVAQKRLQEKVSGFVSDCSLACNTWDCFSPQCVCFSITGAWKQMSCGLSGSSRGNWADPELSAVCRWKDRSSHPCSWHCANSKNQVWSYWIPWGCVSLTFPKAAAHRCAVLVTTRAAEPAGGLEELTSAAGSLKHHHGLKTFSYSCASVGADIKQQVWAIHVDLWAPMIDVFTCLG